ncbi:MAG: hypothetical protein ABW119_22955 [Candidatus Thiodiazotropha lotti]
MQLSRTQKNDAALQYPGLFGRLGSYLNQVVKTEPYFAYLAANRRNFMQLTTYFELLVFACFYPYDSFFEAMASP